MISKTKGTEASAPDATRECAADDCDQPAREDGFCSDACFEAADSGEVSQPTYAEWLEGGRVVTEGPTVPAARVRAFLAEIVEALDVPDSARLGDWEKSKDLRQGRAAFVTGWLESMVKNTADAGLARPGLAAAAAESLPVRYEPLAEDGAA